MTTSFILRLSAAVLLLSPGFTTAATWLILPDGTGDAPTIQAGIDSAAPGDSVLLETGIFTGPGNRNIDLQGKAIVILSTSEQPFDCVVDCEGGSGLDHRGFLADSGEGPGTVFRGFTIRNASVEGGNGGGLYIGPGADLVVVNMRFEGNRSGQRGGGIFCRESALRIERTVFEGNSADMSGGALHVRESELTIYRTQFLSNEVSSSFLGLGGAVAIDSSTTAEMDQVRFEQNRSRWAGGLSNYLSTLVMTDCDFVRNEATDLCGAMYIMMVGIDLASTDLIRCTFVENTAAVAAGALSINGVHSYTGIYGTHLIDCDFSGNTAPFAAGAIHMSGSTVMTNCRVADNSTDMWGGGIMSQLDPLTECVIEECLFTGNRAGVSGGAFYGEVSTVSFRACTFGGNESGGAAGIMATLESALTLENVLIAHSIEGTAVEADGSSGIVLSCSDLYGNPEGDWTGSVADQLGQAGNFSADPLFCDYPAGDWTLRADSPCLPGNHPDGASCGQIGAFGEGCSGSTRTEQTSWSGVKKLFR